MTTPIEEKDVNSVLKVKNISISVVNLELGVGCNIIVGLYDATNSLLRQDLLRLEGETYNAWGNDDDYIFNYVMTQYGFSPVPPPVEPVVEPVVDPVPNPEL